MVTFSGLAVCITLVGTVLRGRAGLRNSLPLYWFFGGLMFLLLVTLQFAVQGLLLTPGRLNFSDWSMAHAHAALFGVFGFWIMGMMTQVFPRLLGATGWYRPVWNTWHLWLTTAGLLAMFFVLLAAGYQQSAVEPAIANVEPSLLDSRAFWLVRMLAGVVMIAGQVFFLLNVLMTAVQARWPVGVKDRVGDHRREEQSQEPRTVRRLSTPVTALLCTLTLGFVPVVWLWLPSGSSEPTAADWASRGLTHEFVQLRENFPARFDEYFGPVNETSFEEALTVGRTVFAGEGCWNCHTRTFAPTPASALGLQTLAVQSAGASTSGSRRIGPDLVGEAAPKSNDWHLAHFYKPTGIVPYSVMPEYPWLTDEQGYPNRRGMALITYVQWLAALGEAGPYRSFSP